MELQTTRVSICALPSHTTARDLDFGRAPNNSHIVLARLGNLFLILALLAATGAHWGVLQSVAWTTMLAGNLSSESFCEAVQNTFNGKLPCELCKSIKAGKQSEQKSESPAPTLKKFEYVNEPMRFVFVAPTVFTLLAPSMKFPDSLSLAPPVPPPRCCFI